MDSTSLPDAYDFLVDNLNLIEPTDYYDQPNGYINVGIDNSAESYPILLYPISTGEWVVNDGFSRNLLSVEDVLSILLHEPLIYITFRQSVDSQEQVLYRHFKEIRASDGAYLPLIAQTLSANPQLIPQLTQLATANPVYQLLNAWTRRLMPRSSSKSDTKSNTNPKTGLPQS
jgi:hypothetical protein